jgi:hypothetical protein
MTWLSVAVALSMLLPAVALAVIAFLRALRRMARSLDDDGASLS